LFKFSELSYSSQRKVIIFSFSIIPIILLITFAYLPVFNMFYYSFTKWDGFGAKKFIGLENYIKIFTDPEYFSVFRVSLYYFLATFNTSK